MQKASVVYINVNAIMIRTMVIILFVMLFYCFWLWNRVERIDVGSDDLKVNYSETNPELIKQFLGYINNSNPSLKTNAVEGKYYVKFVSKRKVIQYNFDDQKLIYNCQEAQGYIPGKKLQSKLQEAINRLKAVSSFGVAMNWREVKDIVPIGRRLEVTDLTSGKRFKVSRVGGQNHIDFEPLFSADTSRLKEIYGGQWSWKRRAVVVWINNRKVAASMNGMPHDEDYIKNNNVKGHFCLYFQDSIHPKDKQNLAHQLMIWKAAGEIKENLKNVKNDQLIHLFITAIDQGDSELVAMLTGDGAIQSKVKKMGIISCTITDLDKVNDRNYNVHLSISYKNGPYNLNKKVQITFLPKTSTGYSYIAKENMQQFKI